MRAAGSRLSRLQKNPFVGIQARVEALHSRGVDVIRLDIGSPDLAPPEEVVAALHRSAQRHDHHGYQSHRGTAALRESWAQYYARMHGVQLEPERDVLPLSGSKEGIFNLAQVWLEPGDVVLVPDPGYQTYRHGAAYAEAEIYPLPIEHDHEEGPDFDAIPDVIARRARLLWLNYPNNPSGATVSLGVFRKAVAFARRHGILLCQDAAYSQITFDGFQAPSVLEVEGAKDVALEFNTLSKSHNMAGWRTAAAVGHPEALDMLLRYKACSDSGQFRPVMDSACLAMRMDPAWIAARNEIYAARQRLVLEALRGLGISVRKPKGAFYLWIPLPEGWSSHQFCEVLLESTGICLAPGDVFGPSGEGYVRLALVATEERLWEAMQRLQAVWPLKVP